MQIEKFKYKPNINYKVISAKNSKEIIKLLDSFKKGYLNPLKSHILNADGLRKYLNSSSALEKINFELDLKKKNIEAELTEIIRQYYEVESKMDSKEITKKAHREYHHLFNTENIEPNKIEFVMMIKVYEIIKVFNNNVRKSWEFVRNIFEGIEVNSDNYTFIEQILVYKVYPRIELCDLTDLLLRRIGYIIQLKKEEEIGRTIKVEGHYHSFIQYGLSTIYDENIEEMLADLGQINENLTFVKKKVKDSCIKNPYFLDSRGKESFNQHHLYIMKIDKNKVEFDEKKIKMSLYIETHLGAEEGLLRQDLIRRFISQAATKDRVKEYQEFLWQYFSFVKETFLFHFYELDDRIKNLFIYHFGPIHFLKLVMYFMIEGRVGFIHRHFKKNQMIRELPFDYLKFILKDWWDEEIYQKTQINDRNSIEIYEKIFTKVQSIWKKERPKVLSKIKENERLLRYFKMHDLKNLGDFLKEEISYLFYTIYIRFLGVDFVYLAIHHSKK